MLRAGVARMRLGCAEQVLPNGLFSGRFGSVARYAVRWMGGPPGSTIGQPAFGRHISFWRSVSSQLRPGQNFVGAGPPGASKGGLWSRAAIQRCRAGLPPLFLPEMCWLYRKISEIMCFR